MKGVTKYNMSPNSKQKFQRSSRVRVLRRPVSYIGKVGTVTSIERYEDYYGHARRLYNVRIGSKTLSLFSWELAKA